MEASNVLGQLPKPGEWQGCLGAGEGIGVVRVPVAKGSRTTPGHDSTLPLQVCLSISASPAECRGARRQETWSRRCPWLSPGIQISPLRSLGFKGPGFEQIGEGPEGVHPQLTLSHSPCLSP